MTSAKNKTEVLNQLKADLKNTKNALEEVSFMRNKEKYDYKAKINIVKKNTKEAEAKLNKEIKEEEQIHKNLRIEVEALEEILEIRNQKCSSHEDFG